MSVNFDAFSSHDGSVELGGDCRRGDVCVNLCEMNIRKQGLTLLLMNERVALQQTATRTIE